MTPSQLSTLINETQQTFRKLKYLLEILKDTNYQVVLECSFMNNYGDIPPLRVKDMELIIKDVK